MKPKHSNLLTYVLMTVLTLPVYAGDALEQLSLLQDVRHEIVTGYVTGPDQDKMIEAAVYAMVKTLDDPFTVYLSQDELTHLDEQVQGRFSGIGIEYTIDEKINRLRVITPLEDSPAWRAGVMAGDIVLEIEGQSTEGLGERALRSRLLGSADTTVTIKVRHETGEEAVIAITRAVINVKSVRGFRRDKNNRWTYMLDPSNRIGYVKIRQFTDRTADELRQALDTFGDQPVQGLILDLRFNPGGLLPAAVAVADLFLDDGKTIVSVRGRTIKRKVHTSTSLGTFDPVPMVVLANEASASAAEIVTGALTDNGRARFIGMRTFGKGSVQQVKMLQSGQGAIKITTAYYYLPSDKMIHRQEDSDIWGVDPQDGFFVPMSPDDLRNMRRSRLDHHAQSDHPGAVTPDWIASELGDKQLAAAVRALLDKIRTDTWPVVGQSGAGHWADQHRRQIKQRRLQLQRDLIVHRLSQIDEKLTKLNEEADKSGRPTNPAP